MNKVVFEINGVRHEKMTSFSIFDLAAIKNGCDFEWFACSYCLFLIAGKCVSQDDGFDFEVVTEENNK